MVSCKLVWSRRSSHLVLLSSPSPYSALSQWDPRAIGWPHPSWRTQETCWMIRPGPPYPTEWCSIQHVKELEQHLVLPHYLHIFIKSCLGELLSFFSKTRVCKPKTKQGKESKVETATRGQHTYLERCPSCIFFLPGSKPKRQWLTLFSRWSTTKQRRKTFKEEIVGRGEEVDCCLQHLLLFSLLAGCA